jgi:ABC-type multidrug transport system ATPase subunit
VVRRDILGAIIRTIADEGRTVLFSSHLLEEVERVSDRVAMLDQGKVVLSGPLDAIKEEHRRLTLRFDEPQSRPPVFGGSPALVGRGATGRRSAGARSTRSRGRPARSAPGSWPKACRRSTRSSWLAWAPVASSRWRPDS